MTEQTEPTPEEANAPLERRAEEDEMRYPGHGDPDDVREDVGLDKERSSRPHGAPVPDEAPPNASDA